MLKWAEGHICYIVLLEEDTFSIKSGYPKVTEV